ncbi:MAG: TIGR00282 family metallophosphoesterase [Sphaerochaetaceae bacterium]|jgi:metallophosphoesterase (TIGR00282 family)|nr:TIGR00282 family metallophosphoesterase [Sphaerochaetaceae bacterium]
MSKTRTITALLLGDVIGQPGCRALFMGLPQLIKRLRADIVVVNGENAANGFGLTEELARQFFALGVHVITSGNHIWQQETIRPLLDKDQRILRPANYPSQVLGKGSTIVEVAGSKIGVLNLQGRHQMMPIDCPFQIGLSIVEKMRRQTPLILVDFHAELPQEKEALALYLDGKVSVVVGTHTHVQTADERILPQGTAYITDLGMSGPLDGVIGSDPLIAIERQMTQLPLRSEILDAPSYLQGVVCSIDPASGKTISITRINEQFGV